MISDSGRRYEILEGMSIHDSKRVSSDLCYIMDMNDDIITGDMVCWFWGAPNPKVEKWENVESIIFLDVSAYEERLKGEGYNW